ncbi:MAG: ribosomal-protein-S5-alanine N-acetyltransferase [Methanocella sp. PtaU1.Bin125]|nr:MAG: ribosomal-protein-S5-alanine N-acetyltransferase [Methanocella sp. PtaU1.Bin125]
MSLKIRTERLELIAETAELGKAEVSGRASLAEALDADVPEDWPPENVRDVVELFATKLHREPELAGWLNWYWLHVEPATGRRTLIGSGGFTSPPVDGVVAIGYSVLPRHQRKGYATEAVHALTAWAFSHQEVKRIIAETLPDNAPSIRVLARNGFRRVPGASEPGHARFALDSA